jgi:septal ring factor EnvC (AmiA/AmiB activator)
MDAQPEPSAEMAPSPVDTISEPVLQTAQPPSRAATSNQTTKRVNHRTQFSLLVVRGDGVRVLRVNFPRRVPTVTLAVLGLFVCTLGVLVGDWWHVRQRMRDAAELFQQIDEQQATIDSVNRRMAQLRQEVTSWREMHARIWEPFGPELAPTSRDNGIGGGRATAPDRAEQTSSASELDRLTEQVMDEGQSLRALDKLIARARKALVALPSRWPVRGAVNSEFGKRLSPWTKESEFHSGIDIAADRGTVVRAPASATVFFAGAQTDYGLTVILDHGENIRTIYGHLSKIKVQQGERVERGTELGLSGNTGRSSGPHLHYEILVKGQSVNPRAYLWN